MDDLATDGWAHAYLDVELVVQSFLRDGLITDITLAPIPILLGRGRLLFRALENGIHLKPLRTTVYTSGKVQSKYEVMRPADSLA